METGDTKFYLSFENNGQRAFANKVSYNITDAIRQVRKEYPNACMFMVKNKVKIGRGYSPTLETHPSYPQP
jgi:hypothetical protein